MTTTETDLLNGIIADARMKHCEEKIARKAQYFRPEGRDNLGRPVEATEKPQVVTTQEGASHREQTAKLFGLNSTGESAKTPEADGRTPLQKSLGIKADAHSSETKPVIAQAYGV